MAQINKTEALRIVFTSAALYEKNLSGNNVMFVTTKDGQYDYVETLFQPHNFLHLSGLQTNLSKERFYDAALHQRLSPKDISFNKNGTTEIKLQILPQLMSIHTTARMVGDYDNALPLLVTNKIAGTVTMAMGFVKANDVYVPNTALKKDIREITSRAARNKIAMIFTKPRRDENYKRLTYIAKEVTIDDALQSSVQEKIDMENLTAEFPIPRKTT
jgi:hypothetical protein